MKKILFISLISLLTLASCGNEKQVFTRHVGAFGYNETYDYIPCEIDEEENINITSKIIYPFNTQIYFKSYIYKSEQNEYFDLINEAEKYFIRLSVCFDRHNLYVDKNKNLVKNLAYFNMNYGSDSYVELEKETYDLLKTGVELTNITDGKFNIFIGELSSLWDDYIKGNSDKPTNEEIEKAKNNVPTIAEIQDMLEFDDTKNAVKFNKIEGKKISATFGGIAKGRSTDLLNTMLDGKRVLISGGQSSIATYGDTFYDVWSIGIKNPKYGNIDDSHYLLYERQGKFSISTSGDYQNCYMDKEGNIYHHIIDPFTGYPSSYYRSVSLIGSNGTYLDALTTALMLSDFEEALALIDKVNSEKGYDFSPIFLKENEDKEIIALVSEKIQDSVSLNENSDMEIVFF